MNLHYSQTTVKAKLCSLSFTTLWIYTILKPNNELRRLYYVLLPYEFTLFSNIKWAVHRLILFYYLMNLHYSQTGCYSV